MTGYAVEVIENHEMKTFMHYDDLKTANQAFEAAVYESDDITRIVYLIGPTGLVDTYRASTDMS